MSKHKINVAVADFLENLQQNYAYQCKVAQRKNKSQIATSVGKIPCENTEKNKVNEQSTHPDAP